MASTRPERHKNYPAGHFGSDNLYLGLGLLLFGTSQLGFWALPFSVESFFGMKERGRTPVGLSCFLAQWFHKLT